MERMHYNFAHFPIAELQQVTQKGAIKGCAGAP